MRTAVQPESMRFLSRYIEGRSSYPLFQIQSLVLLLLSSLPPVLVCLLYLLLTLTLTLTLTTTIMTVVITIPGDTCAIVVRVSTLP